MDIEQLRAICKSLPAVTEDIKWDNDLVFSIGGKMFCVASLEPPFRFSFKVKDEDWEELSQQPGFIPAPYIARAKWVMVTKPETLKNAIWKKYIQQSYELVKLKLTKKVIREIGITP